MSTQVIILMTDKNGQPVHFIKDKLADEQTPSQGALYILQTKVLPVYSHNFISHLELDNRWWQERRGEASFRQRTCLFTRR